MDKLVTTQKSLLVLKNQTTKYLPKYVIHNVFVRKQVLALESITQQLLKAYFSFIFQVFAAIAVSFGPFAVGLGKGYTSPALASLLPNSNNQTDKRIPSFSPHLPNLTITEQQGSWIASLSLLGEKNTLKKKL